MRWRKEDIPLLTEHFFTKYCCENDEFLDAARMVLPEYLLLVGGVRLHRGVGPLPPYASRYEIVSRLGQTEAADSLPFRCPP